MCRRMEAALMKNGNMARRLDELMAVADWERRTTGLVLARVDSTG